MNKSIKDFFKIVYENLFSKKCDTMNDHEILEKIKERILDTDYKGNS